MAPTCSDSTNPLFSPSAALMKRKGPRPKMGGAVLLPTAIDCPSDHNLSSKLDIVKYALYKAGQIYDDDSCSPVVTKRVGFNLDHNRIIPAEGSVLSEAEIMRCWWTSQECKTAAASYCNEARSCIENSADSVQMLLEVLSHCNQSSSDQPENQNNFSVYLSESKLPRGMESDAAPAIKRLRHKHREAVLQCVNKIPKHLKQDLQERMLAARSIQYSRPHKIFARLLGQADALSREQ